MKKRYCILISIIAVGLVVVGIVLMGNKRMSVTECPLDEETIVSVMKECDFPEDIYVEYNEDGVPNGYPAKEINLQENFEWTKKIDGIECNVKYKAGDEETTYTLNIGFIMDSIGDSKNDKDSAQALAGEFLNKLFTSDAERYSHYKFDSKGQFSPIHRDTNFLEESYATEYLQLYEEQCTDNCLNNMEYYSLFTYVDYLADAGDGSVTMKGVELNETNEYQQEEESAQKRNRREYYYTVTLNLSSQGQSKEFKVQGAISLAKSGNLWKNQWKVADVMLSDYEALSIYITGKNVTESL